jgi:hypothetical protein
MTEHMVKWLALFCIEEVLAAKLGLEGNYPD